LDTRLVARVLLIAIAIAAVASTWVAIQAPDDLTRLPAEPAALRLGPRAAEAAQRCREALARERPLLDANSIVLVGVVPVADDRDPSALRVDGSFRDAGLGGASRIARLRCTVTVAGLRSIEITEAGD